MAARITIISTIYKAESTLERLLESMTKQKSPDIEFFLIDNGSPDKCGEMCEKYAKKDSRFTVHHLEENIGYIGARNWALERVEGDYIGFADSDDYLVDGAYDKLMNIVNEHNPDYVVCAFSVFDKDERYTNYFLNKQSGLYQNDSLTQLKKSYIGIDQNVDQIRGYMWRCLYKTSIIKDNSLTLLDEFIPMEDGVFNFDYVMHCKSIYIHDTTIYNCFSNEASVTKTLAIDWPKQYVNIYEYKLNKSNSYSQIDDKEVLLNNWLIWGVVFHLYNVANGFKFKEYIDYVKRAVKNKSFLSACENYNFLDNNIKWLFPLIQKHHYRSFCILCKIIKKIKNH